MTSDLFSTHLFARAAALIGEHWVTAAGFGLGLLTWAVRHPGFFFFLTLPGVIVHELSHWFAAAVLGGRPSRLSIVPVPDPGGGWVLGSVSFHARWWNGAFIALAPVVGNVATALGCLSVSPPGAAPAALLCGYLAAIMLRHASLSTVDVKLALAHPAGLFVLLGLGTWVLQVEGVLG